MKLFANSGRVGLYIASVALLGAMNVSGSTERSSRLDATVESINPQTRILVIRPAKKKGPSLLALTKETKFLRNWKFVTVNDLKSGSRVVVYYRSPLFGKPFVTKVVWLGGELGTESGP